jgi:hypothetical protein
MKKALQVTAMTAILTTLEHDIRTLLSLVA